MRDFNNHRVGGRRFVRLPPTHTLPCFPCLGTTCFPGSLWSGLVFLTLGPHALWGRCGPGLLFLLWDHMLSRDAVVRPCISCFGTTCFPGSLWSGLVFLTLGPHAFPDHCGLGLYFLLWDHILSRITVVRPCISYLMTTCLSGTLWSGLVFLAFGPHPALKRPLFTVPGLLVRPIFFPLLRLPVS